jgi:tRNA threonylcarbamoyladenosine biosynthesis protein TsaB
VRQLQLSTIMVKTYSGKILALDTATERSSIALLEGKEVVAEFRLHSPETHSARLLRSIQFLLGVAGWNLHDLNLVAAGVGPGSFTGIRIGLSTALGMAQTLDIPFVGVSGLDALARKVLLPSGRLGVAVDAKRSQIYYAEYQADRHSPRMVLRPRLWHPADLAIRMAGRPLYIVGDGAGRLLEAMRLGGQKNVPGYIEMDLYLASSIGRLALVRKRSWRAGQGLKCDPLYIRPPDARRPRGRK